MKDINKLEKEREILAGKTWLFCGCEECARNDKRIIEIDNLLKTKEQGKCMRD